MNCLIRTFVFVLSLGLVGIAEAADRGTRDEAMALVRQVVASMKVQGKKKTLEDVQAGKYVDRDLYVAVLDLSGTNLANPVNPRMVGKNLLELKDAEGTQFIKRGIDEVKKKGAAWIDYTWTNPVNGQLEKKSSYVERFDGFAITCGIYQGK
ncbi:MAG TPA: cache domain-containing protein [Noviherbaspirillum sp.]|uniref:cache domain-containing protein n=1 Tax=Noviherbaspirillum sp. TaxID=1926288 RepID=UPI002B4A2C2A|nr:cache domain-containing protein [Noviherbaspirillum sp.]HJV84551.1 cache domain-containing protein [Noviherbaspirillum sp.]